MGELVARFFLGGTLVALFSVVGDLFTPKSFGWGYDLNLFWVVHPMRWLRARRAARG